MLRKHAEVLLITYYLTLITCELSLLGRRLTKRKKFISQGEIWIWRRFPQHPILHSCSAIQVAPRFMSVMAAENDRFFSFIGETLKVNYLINKY